MTFARQPLIQQFYTATPTRRLLPDPDHASQGGYVRRRHKSMSPAALAFKAAQVILGRLPRESAARQMLLPLEARRMLARPPLGTTTSCVTLPCLKAVRKRS